MATIKPLEDPHELAHGGVVVSHTLGTEQAKLVLERCQLLLPSVGIEYATAVPIFGDAAFLGHERTLRELPSHGFRIYDRDIWSGDIRAAPKRVCHRRDPPPPMLGAESCAVQTADRLVPYGINAVRKSLEYWNVPRQSGSVCDAETEVPRVQQILLDDAERFDYRRSGLNPSAWLTSVLTSSHNPIVQGVVRECFAAADVGECVRDELLKRRVDPQYVVDDIARYLADPEGDYECQDATPADVANYYSEAAANLGFVGQEGYNKLFIYGASPQDPAAIAAGDHRLVPVFGSQEGSTLNDRQNDLFNEIAQLQHKNVCPLAPIPPQDAARETRRALAAESQLYRYRGIRQIQEQAQYKCLRKAALGLVASGDEAAFEAALDPDALRAHNTTAAEVFERTRQTFREPPAGYYEGKSYWFVPANLFNKLYLPDTPEGLALQDQARACGLHPRYYDEHETVQKAISTDAGLYVAEPNDRFVVTATVGGQTYTSMNLSGADYNVWRNDLFRLRDLGTDLSVVGCRRADCGAAALAEMVPGARVYSSWDEIRAQVATPENIARAQRDAQARIADRLKYYRLRPGGDLWQFARGAESWTGVSSYLVEDAAREALTPEEIAGEDLSTDARARFTAAVLAKTEPILGDILQKFARATNPAVLNQSANIYSNSIQNVALETLTGFREAVPATYPVAVREHRNRESGEVNAREVVTYKSLEPTQDYRQKQSFNNLYKKALGG